MRFLNKSNQELLFAGGTILTPVTPCTLERKWARPSNYFAFDTTVVATRTLYMKPKKP